MQCIFLSPLRFAVVLVASLTAGTIVSTNAYAVLIDTFQTAGPNLVDASGGMGQSGSVTGAGIAGSERDMLVGSDLNDPLVLSA